MSVAISSGHGLKIRGASGYIDEVDQARRVVPEVVRLLRHKGCEVFEGHDDTSTDQATNLSLICDWHNSRPAHHLDVSCHFNAYVTTDEPMGVEVCFVSQEDFAERMSAAIAEAGKLKDRGEKYRDGLAFLNNTIAPAILLECCFVDSSRDAELYTKNFSEIGRAHV